MNKNKTPESKLHGLIAKFRAVKINHDFAVESVHKTTLSMASTKEEIKFLLQTMYPIVKVGDKKLNLLVNLNLQKGNTPMLINRRSDGKVIITPLEVI